MMYLLKEMDKEQVKVELGKRELKRNKHLAIRAILEMFVNTSTMMLNNIVSHPPGEETRKKLVTVKKAVKEQNAAFMNVRVRLDALTTSMAEKMEPEKKAELEKEYMELRTLQPQMEAELEKLQKNRDTMELELKASAQADFAPVMLAYTNLRTYVNDSLMGVSRMKACSVPQIGDDWSWKAYNKCAPKKRVAKGAAAADAVVVEDA
jgi:PDZ domain-containing secreted protein